MLGFVRVLRNFSCIHQKIEPKVPYWNLSKALPDWYWCSIFLMHFRPPFEKWKPTISQKISLGLNERNLRLVNWRENLIKMNNQSRLSQSKNAWKVTRNFWKKDIDENETILKSTKSIFFKYLAIYFFLTPKKPDINW